MDDALMAEFRRRLLERPGRSVEFAAQELGIGGKAALELARELGLSSQADRLRAAGRGLSKQGGYSLAEGQRVVCWKPGALVHFDGSVIGRLVSNDEAGLASREVVVYAAVDRATGYSWSMVANAMTPANAASAVRSFAAASPFSWAEAAVMTDGRGDVQSAEFAAACESVGARRLHLSGWQPWSNGCVEHHFKSLKLNGFGSLRRDEISTWEEVEQLVKEFVAEVNGGGERFFREFKRERPGERLAALSKPGLTWRERYRVCAGSVKGARPEDGVPVGVAREGRAAFEPLADAFAEEVVSSADCVGLLVRTPARVGSLERRPLRLREPGMYLYVQA